MLSTGYDNQLHFLSQRFPSAHELPCPPLQSRESYTGSCLLRNFCIKGGGSPTDPVLAFLLTDC